MGELHVFFELLAPRGIARLAVVLEQLGQQPLERAAVFPDTAAVSPMKDDVPRTGTEQQRFPNLVGQLRPRRLEYRSLRQTQIEFQSLGHAIVNVPPPLADIFQWAEQFDRSVPQRQRLIRDQPIQLKLEPLAETVAVETHSLRTVETEKLRRRRLVAETAVRAGVVSRVEGVGGGVIGFHLPIFPSPDLPIRFRRDNDATVCQLQRRLDRFGQSRT